MSYGVVLGQAPITQENPETLASKVSYDNSQTSGVINGNNVQEALDDLSNNITTINENIVTINQNIENIGNSLYEFKTSTKITDTVTSSKNFKFCILSLSLQISAYLYNSTIVLDPYTSRTTYSFAVGTSGIGTYDVSTANNSVFFTSSIYNLSSLKANIIFFY